MTNTKIIKNNFQKSTFYLIILLFLVILNLLFFSNNIYATNIGVNEDDFDDGQYNRYDYTGSTVTWTVPVDHIYEIKCYGGSGSYGDTDKSRWGGESIKEPPSYGDSIGKRYSLKKGTVLTIQVGNKPQSSWLSCGGEGSTHGNPEEVSYPTPYHMHVWKHRRNMNYTVGECDLYKGYPDGNFGGYKLAVCDNDDDHSGGAAGGGGGGSSKVEIGSSTLISAKGGSGGNSYVRTLNSDWRGWRYGGSGGGSTTATSLTNATLVSGGSFQNSQSNSGNGYILITAIKSYSTLTVDPNGGIYDGTSEKTYYEDKYYETTQHIEDPTRIGYIFDGWSITSSDGSFSNKTWTFRSVDTTLTARWTPITY